MDASSPITTTDESSLRYEGWRIVAVCFLVATFGWAFGFYGQSVYLAELHRAHGWPASLISGATTFFYLFGALVVVFVGEAVRKFGPRNCLIAGTCATAIAAICARTGARAVAALSRQRHARLRLGRHEPRHDHQHARPLVRPEARHGDQPGAERRELSAASPACRCSVIAIGHFGFPTAMMVAAGVHGRVGGADRADLRRPTAAACCRSRSATSADAPSSTQIRARALRDVGFLSVTTAFALVLFAQVGFIVHLIAFLDPVIGRASATTAIALLTAMAVVGRVLFSTVIDRLNQRLASALSFMSQAAALAALINLRNDYALIAACGVFGFSVGNLITLPSLIVQREFDPRSFGVLVSLQTAIAQVTYAFGPGVVGVLRDLSGSYTLPFYCCIALELTAAVLIMIRGRPETSSG